MKSFIFAIFIIVAVSQANSQTISNIDLDDIKEETLDSTSDYYYPTLVKRVADVTDELTDSEYTYLYYGAAFQENYSPYTMFGVNGYVDDLLGEKKYKQALEVARAEWQKKPVHLLLLERILFCFHKLHEDDSVKAYQDIYSGLLGAITRSGDGKSMESAFVTISVFHEYTLLENLGLKSTGQVLMQGNSGPVDRLILKKRGQKRKRGQKKIKEIYFNVSLPLGSMNSIMKSLDD
jgi:hypothetical protein